jgi:hypothetical protein
MCVLNLTFYSIAVWWQAIKISKWYQISTHASFPHYIHSLSHTKIIIYLFILAHTEWKGRREKNLMKKFLIGIATKVCK